MTGKEFEAWLKRLKMTKARAAVEIGVNVDTITAICQSVEVKRYYALALMAIATMMNMSALQEISDCIGEINSESPKKYDK